MTDTYIFNFYPIFKFILYLFAVVGFFSFMNNVLHTFSNTLTIRGFLRKFPDVKPEFMQLPLKEQTIENNQELWEHDKRFKDVYNRLERIERKLDNG